MCCAILCSPSPGTSAPESTCQNRVAADAGRLTRRTRGTTGGSGSRAVLTGRGSAMRRLLGWISRVNRDLGRVDGAPRAASATASRAPSCSG
eukprot:4553797-Prymnesium_polylepis.1